MTLRAQPFTNAGTWRSRRGTGPPALPAEPPDLSLPSPVGSPDFGAWEAWACGLTPFHRLRGRTIRGETRQGPRVGETVRRCERFPSLPRAPHPKAPLTPASPHLSAQGPSGSRACRNPCLGAVARERDKRAQRGLPSRRPGHLDPHDWELQAVSSASQDGGPRAGSSLRGLGGGLPPQGGCVWRPPAPSQLSFLGGYLELRPPAPCDLWGGFQPLIFINTKSFLLAN